MMISEDALKHMGIEELRREVRRLEGLLEHFFGGVMHRYPGCYRTGYPIIGCRESHTDRLAWEEWELW